MYQLNLSAREAQIIYLALSQIWFSDKDEEASESIRKRLDKISKKRFGKTLYEHIEGEETQNVYD